MRSLMIFTMLVLMISCKAPLGSTPAVSITGIEWKLLKIGDRDLSAVNPAVTLMLDEAKKGISGHGGCNRYFGGYQSSDNTISFTGIGSTKMFCQDTQAVEDAYFKALEDVQAYRVVENKLYFLFEGKVVLEFSK